MTVHAILDTGVIMQILEIKRSPKIEMLCQNLLKKSFKGHITMEIVLEVARHLTEGKGKEIVFPQILSLLEKYHIIIYNITVSDSIKAGIVQYQAKPFLSACDSLITIIAAKEKWNVFTTDKKLIDNTPIHLKNKIKFVKYAF
ncbi:MAG: PIN domain-containing protein [Promethearchaeota archaeon]